LQFRESKARSFVQNEHRAGSGDFSCNARQRASAEAGVAGATEHSPRSLAKALFILAADRIRDQETAAAGTRELRDSGGTDGCCRGTSSNALSASFCWRSTARLAHRCAISNRSAFSACPETRIARRTHSAANSRYSLHLSTTAQRFRTELVPRPRARPCCTILFYDLLVQPF
jgi:hypothetical protein